MNEKIALVNYYNTEPYLYGLEERGTQFDLIRSTPAECTALFKAGAVDIALVPVVTLFEETDASIISDYGICCDDEVKTVVLFSNTSKDAISKIYLDNHSRTSVQLLKIILKNYWKIEVEFKRENVDQIKLKDGEGVLMIGDKVFKNEDTFTHVYDLGKEWKKYTGLPFVFAVWLKRKVVSDNTVVQLRDIFEYGLSKIDTIIKKYHGKIEIDLKSYYSENIHFRLGHDEHKAIVRFKEEIAKANLEKTGLVE